MLNLLLKWTHIEGACTWYLVMVENVEFLTSWKLRRRKGAYFKCRWCTKWILEVKLWLSRSCANAVGVKRHEQNRSCLTLFMCCLTCSFNALIKLLWLLCKYQFCETVYSSHSSFFLYSSQIVQDPAHKLLNSLRVCLLCTWSFFHLFNYCFFFFTSMEPAELTLFRVLTLISTVRKCVMGLCARLGFPYTQILHTDNSDDEWCTLFDDDP